MSVSETAQNTRTPGPADNISTVIPGTTKRKLDGTVISSPYFHKLQRRHYILFEVLPALGTIGALLLLFVQPLRPTDLLLFLVMWVMTGFSMSIGFHRLFTHRSYKTTLPVRIFLTIFGCMAARGSMTYWAAMHRRHHQLADQPGDLHSPHMHGNTLVGRLRGWLFAHSTWMFGHDYPNVVHYVPDLLADKATLKVDRMYYRWVVLGLMVPGVLGGVLTGSWMGALSGFLWGGVVRMFVVAQLVSAVDSFTHIFGSRPFKMLDNHSHNLAFLDLGLLTWGEGWHNNHHAFPDSAMVGLRWYQLDPGYALIRAMEWLGLAWDVRRPDPETIRARRQELELRSRAGCPGEGLIGGRSPVARVEGHEW